MHDCLKGMVYVQEAWFSTWRARYERSRPPERMVGFSIRWLILAAMEFGSSQWFYYWTGDVLKGPRIWCLFLDKEVPVQAKLEAALVDNRKHLDNLKEWPAEIGLCLPCTRKLFEKDVVAKGKLVCHHDLSYCQGQQ